MRIRATTDSFYSPTQATSYVSTPSKVTDKADTASFQDHLKRQMEDPKRDERDQQSPEEKEKTLKEALSEFQDDESTKNNGISASASGAGPGLKIVLTDGSGAVIRQMSGDEFLRLRDAIAGRGKLLDQKV